MNKNWSFALALVVAATLIILSLSGGDKRPHGETSVAATATADVADEPAHDRIAVAGGRVAYDLHSERPPSAQDPEAAGSVKTGTPSMSEGEVAALEQSFEELHQGATQQELLDMYAVVRGNVPAHESNDLHDQLLLREDYEVIREAGEDTMGKRAHLSKDVLAANEPFVTRIYVLPSGLIARTRFDPGDMPAFESDIRHAIWIMGRLRRTL